MHPRLLRTFLVVGQRKNMTRAAADLNLTQSSVSEQVQALEADLGVPLFRRSGRGLELTPAGNTLMKDADDILNSINDARTAVVASANNDQGRLVIGALETIATHRLAAQLTRFRSRNPAIDLSVRIAGSGELAQQLQSGAIDVAFGFDKGERDHRFLYRTIADEPIILVAPVGARWAAMTSDVAAIASETFVVTQHGCIYRKLFDDALQQTGVRAPAPAVEVGSLQMILRMVAGGAGLAIVPRSAAAEFLEKGDIVEIAWPRLKPSASIVAVWRRRRVQSAPLVQLLATLGAQSTLLKPADAHPRRAEPCPS